MYTPFHLQDRWNSILPRSKHLLSALDTRKKKKRKKKKDEGILVPRIFMSRIFRSTYYGEFGGRSTEMICSQPFLVFSPPQLTSTGIPPDGSARNSCSLPFQPPSLSPFLSTAAVLEKIETISPGKKKEASGWPEHPAGCSRGWLEIDEIKRGRIKFALGMTRNVFRTVWVQRD